MPTTVLTVAGHAYNQPARKAASLCLDGWGWDLDSDLWAEFHEVVAGPTPRFIGPRPVSLSVDGAPVFAGDIVTAWPTIGGGGRTWCYRAMGLKNRANWLPVTATDGSGTIRFDVPFTDTDNYIVSLAGKSVGEIVQYCLDQHAAALAAVGITYDTVTAAQLAAITLVPQDPVTVQGERLWQAIESVFARFARNQRLMIRGDGLVRVEDVTSGATHTLTCGVDPVDPPMISRNWTHSATRTLVRGKGNIWPGYVSTLKNTLKPAWTAAQQAAWTYDDYLNPKKAQDKGTITTVNGPTQVTVQSSDGSLAWATNYWPKLQAWIYLFKGAGTGFTYQETRPITACSSLGAGGTATINFNVPLENATAGAFDNYRIVGTNVPLSMGQRADVWRLYNVDDPGHLIRDHLVIEFPFPVAAFSQNAQAVGLTATPVVQIIGPSGGGPAMFSVLPQTGQVIFVRPVVEQTSTMAQLNAGGSSVVAPTDIFMMLAYSRGALSVAFPPDVSGVPQYSGQAYSYSGLARTGTVDVDAWQYAGNTSLMSDLGAMLQQSTRTTLMEGPITYKGYYPAVQDPTGGHQVTIAASYYTPAPDETNLPIRAVTYRYLTRGGGLLYQTEMRVSTRQDPRTGESQYMHLSVLGGQSMPIGGETLSAGAASFGGVAGYTPEALGMDRSAADLAGFTGGRELMQSLGQQAGQMLGGLEQQLMASPEDRPRGGGGSAGGGAADDDEAAYGKFRLSGPQRQASAKARRRKEREGNEADAANAPDLAKLMRRTRAQDSGVGGLRAARGIAPDEAPTPTEPGALEGEGSGGQGSDAGQGRRRMAARRKGSLRKRRFGGGDPDEPQTEDAG